MQKTGLIALADTYNLGRGELDLFRQLTRRFFDHFREEIGISTGAALSVGAIRHRVEAGNGSAGIAADNYVVVLALDGQPAVTLTSGGLLASAILDVALGGEPRPRQDSSRAWTPTEAWILAATMGQAAVAASEYAFKAAVTRSPRFVAIASGRGRSIASALEKICLMPAMLAQCTLGPVTDELALAASPAMFAASHIKALKHHPPSVRGITDKDRARAHFGNTRVEIKAVLGRREMTFSEVRALAPGAIVMLGPLNGPAPRVSLCCGDQVLFDASAVAHRGWNRVLVRVD